MLCENCPNANASLCGTEFEQCPVENPVEKISMTPAQIVNTFRNFLAALNCGRYSLDDCILELDKLELVMSEGLSTEELTGTSHILKSVLESQLG